MAGLFVLLGFGIVHREDLEQQGRELAVLLEKLNQAAAITLAAFEAGASIAETQEAVSRTTAVNWIKVEGLPTATGAVLASADLPQRTMRAEVRVAALSSETAAPSLVSFVTSKSGETVPYVDYVLGTVVKADLDTVTVEVGPKDTRVLILPHGTLPPPVKSQVAAAVNRTDGRAVEDSCSARQAGPSLGLAFAVGSRMAAMIVKLPPQSGNAPGRYRRRV